MRDAGVYPLKGSCENLTTPNTVLEGTYQSLAVLLQSQVGTTSFIKTDPRVLFPEVPIP